MRSRAALWRLAVIIAWLGALAGLVALGEWAYIGGGIPLTLFVGAVLNRSWAIAVPPVVTVLGFVVLVGLDPTCSSCGETDHRGAFVIVLTIFTAPAAIAMAVGVAVGTLFRALTTSARQDA